MSEERRVVHLTSLWDLDCPEHRVVGERVRCPVELYGCGVLWDFVGDATFEGFVEEDCAGYIADGVCEDREAVGDSVC